MKLICYTIPGYETKIRPAPLQRGWMDATADRFAYRCLPLNIANCHGWEVLCPAEFTAVWDGSPGKEAIRIESDAPSHLLPVSHFGSGVLTFHLHCLLRTPPGLDLWVSGPVNKPKHGIQPLAGVVEADWMPYSFTMNWMFTRPRTRIRFREEEPFCAFFPVPRGLVEAMEPEMRPLDSDPELAAQHRAWAESRGSFIQDLQTPGSPAQAQSWQKTYFRGQMPDGSDGIPDHRTKLQPKVFVPGSDD